MINEDYSAHANLRELRNEFNISYKKYIKMSLLESLVDTSIQTDSSSLADDSKSIKMDEKIKEKYFKSNLSSAYNIDTNKDANLMMDEFFKTIDFKTMSLDLEAKSRLVEKIQCCMESRLSKIKSLITDPTELEDIDIDYRETMQKFHDLIDETEDIKKNSKESNEELKIKYEHCLNLAYEVAKLLNTMLTNFRIGFYGEENKEKCEHKIVAFKVLFGKILSTKANIQSKIYSDEKLNALKIISEQNYLKMNLTKEKHERYDNLINSYKSLGNDFEPALDTYRQLKSELERKMFTLNTLQNDNII